jgi:hypothetical protein
MTPYSLAKQIARVSCLFARYHPTKSTRSVYPFVTIRFPMTLQIHPASISSKGIMPSTTSTSSDSLSSDAYPSPSVTDHSPVPATNCIAKHLLLDSIRSGQRRSQSTYCGICDRPCAYCKIWKLISLFTTDNLKLVRRGSKLSRAPTRVGRTVVC